MKLNYLQKILLELSMFQLDNIWEYLKDHQVKQLLKVKLY